MSQLSDQESDAFMRQRFGPPDSRGRYIERKGAALVDVTLGGKPIISTAEYRAAHRALPPGPKRRTMSEIRMWIAELAAGGWPED